MGKKKKRKTTELVCTTFKNLTRTNIDVLQGIRIHDSWSPGDSASGRGGKEKALHRIETERHSSPEISGGTVLRRPAIG